jgi:hypothetical protein
MQHEAKWTSNAIQFFNEASAQGGSQLLSTAAESSQQADGLVSVPHWQPQQRMFWYGRLRNWSLTDVSRCNSGFCYLARLQDTAAISA